MRVCASSTQGRGTSGTSAPLPWPPASPTTPGPWTTCCAIGCPCALGGPTLPQTPWPASQSPSCGGRCMITLKWGGTRVCGRRRYAPHQGQPRSSPRASAQLPTMQARTLWAPRETQAGCVESSTGSLNSDLPPCARLESCSILAARRGSGSGGAPLPGTWSEETEQ